MTYKDIINRFRSIVANHYMLQDFGYGQLSDLKTQSQLGPEEQGVDYPYLFLLPGQHQRQGPVMNYSFNMIVMDMARGEEGDLFDNYITIQSQCQQYIDDVLANLYYYYEDQPEIQLTNINYNPFKEKYQDELAGMTATITIQVPTPLNDCIAPIAKDELVLEMTDLEKRTMGPDQGDDKVFVYTTDVYNPNGDWQINKYVVPSAGKYRIEMEQEISLNQPEAGETIPMQPVIRELTDGPDRDIAATSATGWPTQFEYPEKIYNFKATWEIEVDSINPAGYTWELITLVNIVGQEESTLLQQPNGIIKIYKLA